MKALNNWKDYSAQFTTEAHYGHARARTIIKEAENMPLNDALVLLRNQYCIYSNLGGRIPAYEFAAKDLAQAQARFIVRSVRNMPNDKAIEIVDAQIQAYRLNYEKLPAYKIVVDEIMQLCQFHRLV